MWTMSTVSPPDNPAVAQHGHPPLTKVQLLDQRGKGQGLGKLARFAIQHNPDHAPFPRDPDNDLRGIAAPRLQAFKDAWGDAQVKRRFGRPNCLAKTGDRLSISLST